MTAARVRLARTALVAVAVCLAVFGATHALAPRSMPSSAGAWFEAAAVAATPAVVDRPSPTKHAVDELAWNSTVLVLGALFGWVVVQRDRHRPLPATLRLTWHRRGPPSSLPS